MPLALVIKFQYYAWNRSDNNLITIDEHTKVVSKHGKCWWARMTTISQDKFSMFKEQLSEKTPTWLFLYCTSVPRKVHEDGVLWYRAKLEGLTVGSPDDKELIPQYYRDADLGVSFLISGIEPLPYSPGATPKVPAQASIRYASLTGDPVPENLATFPDGDSKLCRFQNVDPIEPRQDRSPSKEPETPPATPDDLPTVTELLAEIRELNIENRNLRSYMEAFKKFDDEYLFSSEKLMEGWLEDNIHRMFPELEILDRQPQAKWSDGKFGKLDLLAFNKETKAIAIVEVKTRKRRTASGYDQFVRYTTWATRHKKDIIKTYNLHNECATAKVEFYIISDAVNDEMRAVCEEYGIKLVKIMGGIGFESVV